MKNEKNHLPSYGPGPVFGGVVIALTVAAMLCRNLPVFQCGNIAALRIPLIVIGIILILFAVFLWLYAVVITKIDDGILHNHLVTTGAYALVRNPIYSAILILCTGVLMIGGNVLFLILPFLYRAFLTVLIKHTEEKWLSELYGEEYKEYCKKVNRCIPWFPKK